MEEKVFAFWLCSLPGFGWQKIHRLLDYFGSPRDIFYGEEKHFRQIERLSDKDRKTLLAGRDSEKVKRCYDDVQRKGIFFVYRGEEEYPEKLKSFEDMPYGIFYRGRLPIKGMPCVAIVGARAASYEAKQVADKFGYGLAENGVQVISGMARGVDIAAQKGALHSANGRTYAVLGTGVDICYPREHIEPYMMIQENGGLISEFPLGTPAFPYNFPLRNRIISALSDGVLVLEARKGSGSLITAETGLEQGREIFVVPGNIFNPLYEGSNELLKNGAIPVTGVRDILDGLGLFFDEDVVERKKKSQVMLETPEKIVYAMLSLEPVHISRIVEKTGLELTSVMEILFSLQMKRLVQTVGNNYYAVCI